MSHNSLTRGLSLDPVAELVHDHGVLVPDDVAVLVVVRVAVVGLGVGRGAVLADEVADL